MASFWSGILASRLGQGGMQARSALARLRGHIGFWLKALSQPSIDLTLRTHAGLSTRIVESPGSSLSDDELEALVSQLRIVAGRTLPNQSLSYGIFSGERERMSRAVVTLISEETTGRPIAFNALSVMEVELDGAPAEVTHLGLVMIDPDVRGQGFSWVLYGLTALVLFARDGLRSKWISNVSQVPAVVGMVCDTFSDVFPSPHPGTRQSFVHLQLARGIMARHRAVFGVGEEAGFDEARFVIYQRLYWRIGCAQEIPRNHAKTSRRAIQCVLRARIRLRQGRRCPATRPHRPCGRAALSVERGAAWLAAGATRGSCPARIAAAGASRGALAG
jgi:hypothetical protein